MATITEDYVSSEMAKLLKEKGFDEPCCGSYSYRGGNVVVRASKLSNTDLCYHPDISGISAPTLQMAMKWLREVHNIDIFPWKIGKGIYSCAIFNSNTGQDLSSNKDFPSEKYEETVESAIRYCLENLIQK